MHRFSGSVLSLASEKLQSIGNSFKVVPRSAGEISPMSIGSIGSRRRVSDGGSFSFRKGSILPRVGSREVADMSVPEAKNDLGVDLRREVSWGCSSASREVSSLMPRGFLKVQAMHALESLSSLLNCFNARVGIFAW